MCSTVTKIAIVTALAVVFGESRLLANAGQHQRMKPSSNSLQFGRDIMEFLPSRSRVQCIERSSGRLFPFPIRSEGSPYPVKSGISRNLSSAGMPGGNLWAVSHAVRRNLVVDAGFDHGLTHTSTHWEIFLGFTYLLPHRLWPDHRNDRRQAPESYGIN